MKYFHRMLLRAWIGPYILSFSVLLFILVMQFIAIYKDDIFGKGLSGDVLVQLFFFAAVRTVLMAAPVAVLAASLMTFGSLGEYYELAAAKACGISVFRIAAPMFILSVIFTGLLFLFSAELVPKANLKFFTLLYDIQRKKADFAITPGYFYTDIDGYVIRAARKDATRGVLYDVVIYDYTSKNDRPAMILADSATSAQANGGRAIKMTLFHGARHEDMQPESGQPNTFRYSRAYFDTVSYFLALKGFDLSQTDETLFKHHITSTLSRLHHDLDSLDAKHQKSYKTYASYLAPYVHADSTWAKRSRKMPRLDPNDPRVTDSLSRLLLQEYQRPDVSVLKTYPAPGRDKILNTALTGVRASKNYTEFMRKRAEDEAESLNRYICEYHKRFAMPFNAIFFMLIGVSLGAVIRKGGMGLPSLISIAMLVLLYIVDTQGKKLSKEGAMDPVLGAWLTAVVFAPLSVWVTWHAASDISLMDSNRWYELRDWVVKKIPRRQKKAKIKD